jgi:hypothetical protein
MGIASREIAAAEKANQREHKDPMTEQLLSGRGWD